MTDTETIHYELMWRKCRVPDWEAATVDEKAEAFFHFCRNYWYIRHPVRGKRLFDLYEAQEDTVYAWLEHRYTVALKARQIGFSTLVGAYAFWRGYFYEDTVILLISKGEREAAGLLRMSKYGYRFLPEWMKLRGPVRDANSNTKLSFLNESSIESLPSASEPGRGSTANLAVVDEIGFLPNSDDAYAAIEPVAEVGGSIILLGTANGEGNLLHKVWQGSQGVGNLYRQYHGIFHGWWVSGRDQEWYDRQKIELPEHQLWQEYPANAEEAFIRSGRPIFNLDALDANPVRLPAARGYLEQLPERPIQMKDHPEGNLRVWVAPMPKHTYVIGADVAEGFSYGDFSSAHVIDARTNEVVAVWHGHIEADLFGEDILDKLGRWYNFALLGVERNNHGHTVLAALRRKKYPNIYYEVRKGQRFEQRTETMGWFTSVKTKPVAIDELDMAIRGQPYLPMWSDEANDFVDSNPTPRGVDALIIYDPETVAELKTFRRDERGRMMGSPYDDRTMSLAIGNQMIQFAFLSQFKVEDKPPPGSMGYLVGSLLEKETPKAAKRIGSFNVRQSAFGAKQRSRADSSTYR